MNGVERVSRSGRIKELAEEYISGITNRAEDDSVGEQGWPLYSMNECIALDANHKDADGA